MFWAGLKYMNDAFVAAARQGSVCTLVLFKINEAFTEAEHKLILTFRFNQRLGKSPIKLPKVQECDATTDAIKNKCRARKNVFYQTKKPCNMQGFF